MVELAGETADGAIFNLFPLQRYPRAMNALRHGAERAGRSADALEVCHFTTSYLGEDRRACLHESKRMLARYANLPFYGNMLAASGFRREVDAVRAAWREKDVGKAEAAVTDAMADAVTLVGEPAACRERLKAYRLAGGSMAIVFPNPVGESRAAAVERTLLAYAPAR
jgi:alkanesulfonate monooxygenase SsuD/methylene tetrahydromethanopterin reductase-like flavin-dependent oxidoreductase (luciferase family)